jgi:hypothetical protein
VVEMSQISSAKHLYLLESYLYLLEGVHLSYLVPAKHSRPTAHRSLAPSRLIAYTRLPRLPPPFSPLVQGARHPRQGPSNLNHNLRVGMEGKALPKLEQQVS